MEKFSIQLINQNNLIVIENVNLRENQPQKHRAVGRING